MRTNRLAAILTRLKHVTGCDTDSALAKHLNISPQTLSSWKIRGSIPYSICVELAETHRVSLDWLLLGEGTYVRTTQPEEAELLEQLRALTPHDRQAVRAGIQDRLRLRELERRVETLNEHIRALTDRESTAAPVP